MKKGTLFVAAIALVLFVGVSAQAQQKWTGNGGSGKSITIVELKATGLAKGHEYLPVLVQGELLNNFMDFSAINVFDRQNIEKVYLELMEGVYSETSAALSDLGHLAPTDYILGGNITKTATGYNLQLWVNRTSDKSTVASYSGTSTFAELDNLTGVRRASAELLGKLGVTLTEQGKVALTGAATTNHVSAQTALAHGIVAQRQGTEVAALSYFYQAAAFDPSLAEAVGRSKVMSANISSANIGENIRNDIVWRRDWVARLKETEEVFHKMISSADPPYTLLYFTDIKTESINYQTETANLSIPIRLDANGEWFTAMQQALQAAKSVMDGLNATNRKNDWQLRRWPGQGVSDINPFGRSWQYDITVDFELVDQRGRVIGKQTVKRTSSFNINHNFSVTFDRISTGTVTFNAVKADDISDNLTIRIARVNGSSPETARFRIVAFTPEIGSFTDNRDGKTYKTVVMPDGKEWMAENMNFQIGNSWCYDNDNSNCNKYGRLYDWNTAMTTCPVGWRLPSDKEWTALVNAVGEVGGTLRSKAGWYNNRNGTDQYGFSALPGGGNFLADFQHVGVSGHWWTATEDDAQGAWRWDMVSGSDRLGRMRFPKSIGISVRCVRDVR